MNINDNWMRTDKAIQIHTNEPHEIECKSFVFRWSLIFMSWRLCPMFFFLSFICRSAFHSSHLGESHFSFLLLLFVIYWFGEWHFTFALFGNLFNNFLIRLNWEVSIRSHYRSLFLSTYYYDILWFLVKSIFTASQAWQTFTTNDRTFLIE